MQQLENAPMFAELSDEDWADMPISHRLMAPMPVLPMQLAECDKLRTRHYVVRPPLKPISKLPFGGGS